jgi:hypothetical protein
MRALVSAVLIGLSVVLAAPALAEEPGVVAENQERSAETAAEERATQFVGVTGPEAESIPAVVWLLLFLFLLRMRGLQRQTAEELERLSAEIRASEGP